MKWLKNLLADGRGNRRTRGRNTGRLGNLQLETLEGREMMTGDILPVLMVIADQQDFYYQEYNDTRISLEAAGLDVEVAATTMSPSVAHAGSGQGGGDGIVQPDIALSSVDAADYSAIVFVGGWGSSMYQYDFPGDYSNNLYDGDAATKTIVNDLIGDFLDQDKQVAAICHATTILAWARYEGASPIAGKQVSIPYIGSPAVFYDGAWYGNYELGQYEQAVANGAIANTASGQYGDPTTNTDDAVVDGQIITGENYDSALYFGEVVANEVIAAANVEEEIPNQAPIADDALWQLQENSPFDTVVGTVVASDADAGQTLSYAIVAGNTDGAFAIDSATGEITVANPAAIDFEATPLFQLIVEVTDDATEPLMDDALVTIELLDVDETPPNQAPTAVDALWQLQENSPLGTPVGTVAASDPDAGQTLEYAIVAGNTNGAFAIDPATGEITVANPAAIDFETTPLFQLTVQVTDDASEPLMDTALVTIELLDLAELPPNQAPTANDALWQLEENTPAGTHVGNVVASDPDAGQSLNYAIVAGNTNGAFAINPATGEITVANAAAINFEATPIFQLIVEVTDDGADPLMDTALVTIELLNVVEPGIPGAWKVNGDLVVQGTTNDDTIYIWSGAFDQQVWVWMNGQHYGSFDMTAKDRVVVYGSDGNDRIYATDTRRSVEIHGEGGHDQMSGGIANDILIGGEGTDRMWGGPGDDFMQGGAERDYLYGREGNDILLGGEGNDYVEGYLGNDILIGGEGSDYTKAGDGDDLVIGGTTDYDNDETALRAIHAVWNSEADLATKVGLLTVGLPDGTRLVWGDTVHNDGTQNIMCTGDGSNMIFAAVLDAIWTEETDEVLLG